MSDDRSTTDGGRAAATSPPPDRPGLLRSIAHRLAGDAAELPVEGRLASFDGATGWLNSEPLTPEGLRGRVVLVDFWTYTCVNWLRTLPVRPGLGREVRRRRPDGRRRPHAGVRLRARPRQRRRAVARLRRRVPDRGRQRLRRLARLREPLLAGGLPRRRRGPDPVPPLRRGRVRDDRDGHPAAAARRRRGRASTRTWSTVEPRGLEVAADWRTLRSPETYLGYGQSTRLRVRTTSPAFDEPARLRRAATAAAQLLGPLGDLDGRPARRGARTSPADGSRSSSTRATSTS